MIFPIRFNEKNRRKLIFQQSSKKSINKFLKLLVQCYSCEFVEKILVNKKLNTTFDELHIIITFALIISISRSHPLISDSLYEVFSILRFPLAVYP
ncbi:hypothetical protein LMANV2_90045 [Leptospira interrogans serovar Manilae]|uniref:Uncharacterized protein n=1 Tax=Leptospira interrogans serovar Manilae TaxID=214675 RepID=A0AAQ1SR15_LEPIR|nr:hypothetical protein [Leptospira interrogans]SOR63851.1 hypothetical protein LMANV2_90045 [Leptospira interrogans serovar Manilae]